MTQEEMVLEYMRQEGSITPWEALKECGCFRLAAVIHRLRGGGYDIRTDFVAHTNRFGHKRSFGKYSLTQKRKNVKEWLFD